jgi:hypothetical protein
MQRTYVRTSSLARKFFEEDFPDADKMPLMLSPHEQQAYEQLVRPLMDLLCSPHDTAALLAAVKQLISIFIIKPEHYELSRSAAEYIQAPGVLCLIDAAGAVAVPPQSCAFYAALSVLDPAAFNELLQEVIWRRGVANHIADAGFAPPNLLLDKHPAVLAAKPCPNDLDRVMLPEDAAYTLKHVPGSALAAAAAVAYKPFQFEVQLALHDSSSSAPTATHNTPAAAAAAAAAPSILKRAVWRRALTRSCSRYLQPLLGRDGQGTVMLTGGKSTKMIVHSLNQLSIDCFIKQSHRCTFLGGACISLGSASVLLMQLMCF